MVTASQDRINAWMGRALSIGLERKSAGNLTMVNVVIGAHVGPELAWRSSVYGLPVGCSARISRSCCLKEVAERCGSDTTTRERSSSPNFRPRDHRKRFPSAVFLAARTTRLSRRAGLVRRKFARNRWGWPCRLQRLVRLDSGGILGIRDDLATAALLLRLQIAVNSSQIVVETGGVRIARSSDFVNDRVGPRHGLTSIISSGVQMIEALNPFRAQMLSI